MANFITRAFVAFGRFTGLVQRPVEHEEMALIQEVNGEGEFSDSTQVVEQSAEELPPLDAPAIAWGDALGMPEAVTQSATDVEAAVAMGELEAAPAMAAASAPDQPVDAWQTGFSPFVTDIASVLPPIEETKAPVELKPEKQSEPSIGFEKLYEMVSAEVNKRTDQSVAVYERILAATQEELDAARRNNKIAWSVGGVMSAVAAFGAIWAAGEVSGTHVEVANLKQQVVAGQQASAERDQLRNTMMQTRDATAKLEINDLKSRLDQAIAVSADRDRVRTAAYENLLKTKNEIETELRLARTATTQPVSSAQPASSRMLGDRAAADGKVVGSERPDVWSTLLNGKDER